ncbi:MAG: GNAT family N-acetyltransferase [Rhizobiales bacterium]|nr:GNAT family N-acetyltransferase [Hyphomicrobiales bacterium]
MQTARLHPANFRVLGSIEAAAESWRALEREGASSLYQSYDWCAAWLATVGAAMGVAPRIVVIEAADGQPVAVLPFQLRKKFGTVILEWLGAPHVGYGYGLFAKDFLPRAGVWFAQSLPAIFETIGEADLVLLQEMPEALHGACHPLVRLFNLRGANRSFAMALRENYDELYATKRSGETRRSNRKRDHKLADLGILEFGLPSTPVETAQVLDHMFADQANRLAESGVYGVFGETEQAFIRKLAEVPGLLAPFCLKLDGRILAVMLGGIHGGNYWALISSLADGPERRFSPGDAALRRTIEACCARGLTRFDFSAGDTSYKPQWADVEIGLHCFVGARRLRGLPLASAYAAAILVKGLVKRNGTLRRMAMSCRRAVRGKHHQ